MPKAKSNRRSPLPIQESASRRWLGDIATLARAQGLAWASLVLAVTVIYFPTLWHGHFPLDSYAEEPLIQDGLKWDSIITAFSQPLFENYIPLTLVSYMLDMQLWGPSPVALHATNIVLHAANALLLYEFLRRTTFAPLPSFVAAAIFAFHPLRVESVAWLAERKDVLSLFFGLLAMLAYVGYARRGGWMRYVVVVVLLVAALCSKQNMVTLPCVLLLLDFWPLGRLRWGQTLPALSPSDESPLGAKRLGWLITEKIPLLAASAAFCYAAIAVATTVLDGVSGIRVPFDIRTLNFLASLTTYLEKTFWPAGLCVMYLHPGNDVSMLRAGVGLAVLATVSLLALWQFKARPYLIVGWLWFLGTMVPTSGLVPSGYQAMADRFTYFPHIGLIVALVWCAFSLVPQREPWLWRCGFAGLVVALFLAISSSFYVPLWSDPRLLWAQAVAVDPDNGYAHTELAQALAQQSLESDAESQFLRAIELRDPRVSTPHERLALLYLKIGELEKAKRHFRIAVDEHPFLAKASYNLAALYEGEGNRAEAKRYYALAIEHAPQDVQSYVNLAAILIDESQLPDAEAIAQQAVEVNPHSADAWNTLGLLHIIATRPAEAERCWRRALAIDAEHEAATANLVRLHSQ